MHKTPSTLPAVAKPETALRINRFLAAAGLGSRRSCEEHILEGRVSINGSFCRNLATRVTPEDDVRVNGKQIQQAPHRYFLLHKPAGYVSTRSDQHAARTIFDLLPLEAANLFHVGRLDKESEGLLLLTNDGIFAQNLLHPSRGVDKEYEVTVDQPFTAKAGAALTKGTWIEGAVARVESVYQLNPYKIKVVLHQGIKRQIRVMLGQLGFEVNRLVRVRIGPIKLQGLASGHYRQLRPQEVEALRAESSKLRVKKTKKASPLLQKLLRRPVNKTPYSRTAETTSRPRFATTTSRNASGRDRIESQRSTRSQTIDRSRTATQRTNDRPSFASTTPRKTTGRPRTGAPRATSRSRTEQSQRRIRRASPRFSNR